MLTLLPFAEYVRFGDGFETIMMGNSEADCVESAVNRYGDEHGDVTWYSGADNDYYSNGELIVSDEDSKDKSVLTSFIDNGGRHGTD